MIERKAAPVAYSYLEARPHPWRLQSLCLRGNNMTVGQLLATMRANQLTPEQAAADLDLPLAQIAEALFYYAEHHDLVDSELREDRTRLEARGYAVELRLYLDDCAYSKILLDLFSGPPHRHSVAIPVEVGLRGAPDEEHFAYAHAHHLTLVTKNPDDFEILHRRHPDHPGIFAIYQDNDPRDMSYGEIVQAIAKIAGGRGGYRGRVPYLEPLALRTPPPQYQGRFHQGTALLENRRFPDIAHFVHAGNTPPPGAGGLNMVGAREFRFPRIGSG